MPSLTVTSIIIILSTNSLCVRNGNLVLYAVCVSCVCNQQQLELHACRAGLVCAKTCPHPHVQWVLKLYDINENCSHFSRCTISWTAIHQSMCTLNDLNGHDKKSGSFFLGGMGEWINMMYEPRDKLNVTCFSRVNISFVWRLHRISYETYHFPTELTKSA